MKNSRSLKIKIPVLGLIAIGLISFAAACNHNDDEPSTETTIRPVATTTATTTPVPTATTPPAPVG